MEIRTQSRGEEIANSASHGLGLAAALAAMPILIVAAARAGSAANIVAACIFATSMVLLYLSSTLYHAVPGARIKRLFQKLDHGAIYLLIAGTYTPFTLGVLHGAWGWTLFGVVWGLAGIGLALKAVDRLAHPLVSTGLYLLMGWLVLIAIRPLTALLPSAGLIWLSAGGLAYTVGVVFYLADSRWRYSHFVWHLFVIAGTTCHFFAVLWYAA
ncbi:hemolysin-III related [mine drainage metagenome]|uniref:Hemolysin-III related n=1 Tax=mine drainage metagenome TaxID=410659 RepID=A0A1J5SF98_9ZZZZ